VATTAINSVGTVMGVSQRRRATENASEGKAPRFASDQSLLRISQDSDLGGLAVAISRQILQHGVASVRGMGSNSTRMMVRIGIVMPTVLREVFDWRDDRLQVALFPEMEIGEIDTDIKSVRTNYEFIEPHVLPQEQERVTYKVGRSTHVGKLAGAIAARVEEHVPVEIVSFTAAPINQAMKAIMTAQDRLNRKRSMRKQLTLGFLPFLRNAYSEHWQKEVNETVLQVISV